MKYILLTLASVTLFASTGCIVDRDRDHRDDRDHAVIIDHHDDHGVDHGEHPGDMDHNDNR